MRVPQTYKIDQAATFAGVVLLSVEPKLVFGGTEQEVTAERVPKWEAQLVAGFRQFGKVSNEVLKVGVAASRNPGEGVAPYTPVELVGLEIGVMNKENKKGEIIGAHVWYRAEEVRSTAATGPRRAGAEVS
ncbi:MAG: hypothetical protein ACRDQX_07045 [Pseudonocardiaceae bacterium]